MLLLPSLITKSLTKDELHLCIEGGGRKKQKKKEQSQPWERKI